MNEDRYLYCETITGEWWYKDMKTGEDLPMYSTPIYRPTIEELNEECSVLHKRCKYLQSKIDKISEYVDKIYDVMDYKDYPPYLDEIYYTLHPELKDDK